jgi:hypothetical protein
MSVPGRGLDPLLKEILQACADLPRARPEERRAFWQAMGDWQTRLDNLATSLRIGGSVVPAGGMGGRGADPKAEQRPEEVRRALLSLHFGLPRDEAGSPLEKLRADLDHLTLRIDGSEVLAGDVGVKQRRELVANKLVLARGSVPAEVHVAMLGLVVRCYRALREEASRPEERPAPPRVVVAAPEEAPADPDPGADAGG